MVNEEGGGHEPLRKDVRCDDASCVLIDTYVDLILPEGNEICNGSVDKTPIVSGEFHLRVGQEST